MVSLSILLQVTDTLKVTNVAGPHLTFFELLIKGGVILIPIAILSLCSFYLIAEKYYVINKGTKVSLKLRSDFKLLLIKGKADEARELLKTEKGAYSEIFTHCIDNLHCPAKEIENEIESVSNIEVSKLNTNMNYLGIIAGIAPMLGFIGTISGIIKIFYNISITDNISIGIISGGLYEKMISSGSGLIVGVIAFTGFHILNMKLDRFVSMVEAEAFDVMKIIKKSSK